MEAIQTNPTPGERLYDPSSPDADDQGYVTMPNVNLMEEMVNMMNATRAFEANTIAVKAQKDMAPQGPADRRGNDAYRQP
ncbi:MAG: hypothetical protein MZU91_03005 [Desulfosudis oleivorans]|nr:hypothetical protein [Desulfosudis oleivorans]